MHSGSAVPLVRENTIMKDVLLEMTSKRLGVTGVVNKSKNLVGVITDGDLRRALEKHSDLLNKKALEIMTTNPKWISWDALAVIALELMEEYAITALFVYKRGKPTRVVGVIHLHDLLKAGIV
jgi:FOG: CBS domain